jgi:hypothetical protein
MEEEIATSNFRNWQRRFPVLTEVRLHSAVCCQKWPSLVKVGEG